MASQNNPRTHQTPAITKKELLQSIRQMEAELTGGGAVPLREADPVAPPIHAFMRNLQVIGRSLERLGRELEGIGLSVVGGASDFLEADAQNFIAAMEADRRRDGARRPEGEADHGIFYRVRPIQTGTPRRRARM